MKKNNTSNRTKRRRRFKIHTVVVNNKMKVKFIKLVYLKSIDFKCIISITTNDTFPSIYMCITKMIFAVGWCKRFLLL
jgi:hypothetical protein